MHITEQHSDLLADIKKQLPDWSDYTIAIDGRDGSGKSTIARLLAWKLEMPALETDLFMIRGSKPVSYYYDDLKKLIDARHSLKRPLILEGIKVLETLDLLKVKPDYLVLMIGTGYGGSEALKPDITQYLEKYQPESMANFTFRWNSSLDYLLDGEHQLPSSPRKPLIA